MILRPPRGPPGSARLRCVCKAQRHVARELRAMIFHLVHIRYFFLVLLLPLARPLALRLRREAAAYRIDRLLAVSRPHG